MAAGDMILISLAAMGLMSLVWALLGWLLPDGRGCALVCFGAPDAGVVARYRWLRGMGLLRCPLIAVDAEGPDREHTERIAGEDLLARLEWERKVFGTGNGDSPGRCQCRGVSEL